MQLLFLPAADAALCSGHHAGVLPEKAACSSCPKPTSLPALLPALQKLQNKAAGASQMSGVAKEVAKYKSPQDNCQPKWQRSAAAMYRIF